MRCTDCHLAIPFYDEDITVHVVYSDERGTQRHCQHKPFDESDPAILAILGSQDCLAKWLSKQRGEVSH
jgi:hypothetical protein